MFTIDVFYTRIMAPRGHAVASSEQSSQRLPVCPLPTLKLEYSSEDQRAMFILSLTLDAC